MKKKLLNLILAFLTLTGPVAPPAQSEMPETMPISGLAVPTSLGKIQDRFKGTSKHWVVQIQDVHGHVPAQENISAILDHLQSIYGIKTVAVEGGWLSSSLPKSWALPNSREKQLLARALLEDGYLTGPGYAAIFSSMPLTLVGVEDETLYLENRKVFLKYLSDPKFVDQKISEIARSLQEEKNSTYNPDLLTFDKRLLEFREGNKAESFLPSVIALAGEHQIDLLKLAQVALFSKILDLSQMISQDRLKAESERMTKQYSVKRLSFEELLRSGKIPQEDLEYYPEMQKYIEVMKLQDQMDHILFFDQIEELIKQVKAKLIKSVGEKTLDQKSERWMLAKKMLTFKATPKDFFNFSQDQTEIEVLAGENQLTEALNLSRKFYKLAQKRDEIFFQKLTTDERLNSDVAIVTGGFHTEGLSAQLRAAGISYVVITPDLAGEMPNEKIYHKMLQLEAPKNQTLAPILQFLFTEFDRRFEASAKIAPRSQGQGFNISAAKIAVENPDGTISVQTASLELGPKQATITAEAFLALNRPEQTKLVQGWLKSIPKGQKVVLGISAQDLNELSKKLDASPELSAAWKENVLYNRLATLILAMQAEESIPGAVIGGSVRVDHMTGQLEDVFHTSTFQKRYGRDSGRIAAIVPKSGLLKSAKILELPQHPAALAWFPSLILLPQLRALASNDNAFGIVLSILSELQGSRATRTAA